MVAITTNWLVVLLASLLGFVWPGYAQDRSAGQAQTSRTWAVVVGVSKYQRLPGGQQLQFADRDATLFADALRKAGVGAENIRTLIGAEATASAIKAVIGNWLARSAAEKDTVILFFSGHGIFEREFGESYLLGCDSDPKDPYTSALSVSEINQALKTRVRAHRVLILVDAVRRDFFDPDGAAQTDAASFTAAFNTLASSRAGASVMIASGPGEFSREGQRWDGHGVFTRHLADALATGGDRNADGLITAEELQEFVTTRVSDDTSGKQHPWRSKTAGADMIVARIERQSAPPSASARNEPGARLAEATRDTSKPKPESPTNHPAGSKADTKASSARDAQQPAPVSKGETDRSSIKPSPAPSVPANERTAASIPKTSEGAATPSAIKNPQPSPRTAEVESRREPPRSTRTSPPAIGKVDAPSQDQTQPQREGDEVAVANMPAPPRPVASPPNVSRVSTEPMKTEPAPGSSTVPASSGASAPSPLVLQIEALIASKNLIEPKNAAAWDLYQRLNSDPSAAAEAARLKPMLANALADAARSAVAGDVRADNISDLVDDFKRAGQMFVRARALGSQDPELGLLEKLGAAEALIALQFYDEAERALSQLQTAKLAAAENASGLVFHGKLDTFRAERAFKRAIELDPKWAAPHYNLALLYRGQQNEQALVELESAAALDPANVSLVVALGDEYFAREQWQRAGEAFRNATVLRPSDASLHTKLGHALYSQGLKADADREYERARQLRGKQ
ncbi:MAG TPA: caspase family protein [Blastocatellia bacterium]|nr:caspase family protein [Blastocatellia bacterium]